MLVKDWMVSNPITIDENASIMKATQLMKEHNIRRIPVIRQNRLVGIVSDRDIKEAAPSKATSLDVHELYYLLSEIKLKDIMTKEPITLKEDDSVEKAAVIMLENKISGLPVVNDQGAVTGIITQTDVFKVMISITGIYRGPIQIAFDLEDRHGATAEVLNLIRSRQASLVSVLTSQDHVTPGRKEVYVRIKDIPEDQLNSLVNDLKKVAKVLYVKREILTDIPRRPKKS
ncbi:MAG: CBS and ACT domain-containing protein [Dissulfurimicrobium sp.]|uniref:CBS and ACT domain-containing protein n=1 Tax=Dissulfurimicrobium TaxID=1769732 RepID=UPI001EDAEBA6|nr:CBS and ACT domain-containing protein [Dissulfurimicrobium hydrothermale]UKL13354.1 CBS and ACT domain-containing protein [Dissulfurimicrobium hydrothermale]